MISRSGSRPGGTQVTQYADLAGSRVETTGPQIGPQIIADHPEAADHLLRAASVRAAADTGC